MRLAIFDRQRLGVVVGSGVDSAVADVTDALPWPHDPDPVTAGWWRRLCRDFGSVRPVLEEAARRATPQRIDEVRLQAPVLGPSKIIAAACNYAEHVTEMHEVQQRTLGRVESWMMDFDVFLKAPSSISGPADDIVLPPAAAAAGHEIHHESELVAVVGTGGRDIPAAAALSHLLGYTIGLDITIRGAADRSRRKSYDTFSPLGPWLTTLDEAGDVGDLEIELECNGARRQKVNTSELLMPVPDLVAYASSVMTLLPGDVIFTGAPSGVGPIAPGDTLHTRITRLGDMELRVR
jgi:2-keto-4-pentenoate hydratase/2-oxohepta-3-ene-1,7-dioic acid hydratase in catechol pathway